MRGANARVASLHSFMDLVVGAIFRAAYHLTIGTGYGETDQADPDFLRTAPRGLLPANDPESRANLIEGCAFLSWGATKATQFGSLEFLRALVDEILHRLGILHNAVTDEEKTLKKCLEAYKSPDAVYEKALGSEVKSLKVEYEQEVAARQGEFAKKRSDAGDWLRI